MTSQPVPFCVRQMDGAQARFCPWVEGIFSHPALCRLHYLWDGTWGGRFFSPPEPLGHDCTLFCVSSDSHHAGRRGHMARGALGHPNLKAPGEDGWLRLGVLLVHVLRTHLCGRAPGDRVGEWRPCTTVDVTLRAYVRVPGKTDRCGTCGSVSPSPPVMTRLGP
jgi:hypothetical protein